MTTDLTNPQRMTLQHIRSKGEELPLGELAELAFKRAHDELPQFLANAKSATEADAMHITINLGPEATAVQTLSTEKRYLQMMADAIYTDLNKFAKQDNLHFTSVSGNVGNETMTIRFGSEVHDAFAAKAIVDRYLQSLEKQRSNRTVGS